MKLELKRIDPLRTANVAAIIYGLMLLIFSIIAFPFFLLMAILAPDEAGFAGPLFGLFILVFYPLIGIVMGWISGLLTAAIYNFVIRWSGGLLFDFDDVSPMSRAEPIQERR